MKTTDTAIDKVYSMLKAGTIPVYKLLKPTKATHTSYVVINSLPINAGVLQKCYVNVNYHAKDLAPGIPDLNTLKAGTKTVMEIVEFVGEKGIIIDFESQEYFQETQLDEHYSNIRLSVKIINT